MTTDRPTKVHWVVRMNHRNRSLSFAIVFGIFGWHFHQQGYVGAAWWLLGLQFLVYPHLVYAWARWSDVPLRTELHAFRIDALCFGLWSAWLGFPLWISYTLVMGGVINLAAFRGFPGAAQSLLLSVAGALLSGLVLGWRFVPDTSLSVTVMTMACLCLYLLLFAKGAHRRALTLSDTRYRLRQSEQALQAQLAAVQALQAQLTEQANRDPLTGLYNRRYLSDTLQREFDRCARAMQPVSLLMIDIDHFKHINDNHGHTLGDRVLQDVATMLLHDVRSSDVVCRYGGEEFLVLLPEMGGDAALARAEWYRLRASSMGAVGADVTLSIGVACSEAATISPQRLIDQADDALYQAKLAGRNRCVLHGQTQGVRPMGGMPQSGA